MAASAIGRCVKLGVAMITASTSGSAQIASGSVVTLSTPQSLLRCSSSSAFASQAATSFARESSRDRRHMVVVADRAGADDSNPDRHVRMPAIADGSIFAAPGTAFAQTAHFTPAAVHKVMVSATAAQMSDNSQQAGRNRPS